MEKTTGHAEMGIEARPSQVVVPPQGILSGESIRSNPVEIDEENAEYPEGGMQAWLVVAGAWCAMIPSMGLLNTIGVIHAWMAEHQLEHYSESTAGWIVSAYAFFLYIGAAQIGQCPFLSL